jgi:transcriptional regulator with XRE-family HTH domain
MTLRPGDVLRRHRTRAGMTTRQVEEMSRAIANAEDNDEFFVSHARIIQVENNESTPSIYKLYSLSAIYGLKITDLLGLYLNMAQLSNYQLQAKPANTRLLEFEDCHKPTLTFPIRFDPGFRPDHTTILSRIVEVWGEIPGAFLQHLRLRQMRYAYIGLEDFTLYPLLRPGSFVQIDDSRRKIANSVYKHESERPIYFLELRDAYVCAWCEIHRDRLIAIPHPLSPCRVREFEYPNEVDVIGQVIAIATRLTDLGADEGAASPWTAKRSFTALRTSLPRSTEPGL